MAIISKTLVIYSIGYVWLAQNVSIVAMFLFNFKQRVTDNLRQGWLETVNTAPRCSTYN